MAMFMSFMGAIMVDLAQPECLDNMGAVTGVLAFCLGLNSVIGTFLCLYVLYLFQSRAYTEYDQMYIGRCLMITETSRNKIIFTTAYVIDLISVALLFVEVFFHSTATEHCRDGFLAFYNIAIALQCFIVLRIFLFCVQFTGRRRPFYSWLKRRFPSLQTIESEQRVTLNVYQLDRYVAKLKNDVQDDQARLKRAYSMGSAEAIASVDASELECSICLEKIQHTNSLLGRQEESGNGSGLVTPLPCNALHVFHPACIRLWLYKSSACPLCKFNAFTGEQYTPAQA